MPCLHWDVVPLPSPGPQPSQRLDPMEQILGPPWFPGFTRAHILWAGEGGEQKGPRVGAPGPSHPPAGHSTKRGQFEKTTQLLISQCMARDASCHKHHSAKGNASDSCEEGFAEQKTWAAIPLCSKNAAKPRCQQPPAASTASLLLLQALPSLWRQCSSSCHVILRP